MRFKAIIATLLFAGMYAQNYSPDPSFGVNGIANTDIVGRRHIWVAPDEKIYTIQAFLEGIVRFNADGSPDSSFGNNGSVGFVSQFGQFNYDVNGIIPTASGIFVFGYFHSQGSSDENIFVAKIDSSGNLDPTFGENGVSSLDYGQNERIWSAHLTNSGEIICTGWRDSGSQRKMILIRLHGDGSKDLAFGIDGIKEYTYFPSITFPDYAVVENTNLYLSYTGNDGQPQQSRIVKLDAAGNPVTGFGEQGILYLDSPHLEQITKLSRKGKNLYILYNHYDTSLAEYVNTIKVYDLVSEAYTLDLPLTGTTRITDFYVTPDEKIMTFGYNFCSSTCYGYDVSLVQYTPDGLLDTGFNDGGIYTFNYNVVNGQNTYEIPGVICPVNDSKILVSAEYWLAPVTPSSNTPYLTIARLTPEALGLNDTLPSRNLTLFPNPANDYLYIGTPYEAGGFTCEITNVLGETILLPRSSAGDDSSYGIDVSGLASGLYILKLKTSRDETLAAKFIKR